MQSVLLVVCLRILKFLIQSYCTPETKGERLDIGGGYELRDYGLCGYA